jgi:hypothetical protein
MNSLQHPFVKLPDLENECIMWIAKFYNPHHSGKRDRLERLLDQVRIVMRIGTCLKFNLEQAKNACLRTEAVKKKLTHNVQGLVKEYRLSQRDIDSDDEEEDVDEFRIACLFMRKRYLLHMILFVLGNEPEIFDCHKKSIKSLEDLVEEDTTDWMEILDYVETLKNPNYLNAFK